MSLAVGYCDVVVTERKWTHMSSRTDLPKRVGKTVLSDLAALGELLVTASATG